MMNGTNMTALIALATIFAAGAGAVSPDGPTFETHRVARGGYMQRLTRTDTAAFSITIDPWRATTFELGSGNSIVFPAGAVCDPARSLYGSDRWDEPCVAARRAVTVNVKAWLDTSGHPAVDFSPNIRFVPSLLPTGWVKLSFADSRASNDQNLTILSCVDSREHCAAEATADSTLATHRDAATGKLTRRIKHFSGYGVGEANRAR